MLRVEAFNDEKFSFIRSFHASHRLNPMIDGTVRNIFLGCLIELAGSFACAS